MPKDTFEKSVGEVLDSPDTGVPLKRLWWVVDLNH